MEIIINNNESICKTLSTMKESDILILKDGIYKEKVEVWINNITIKAEHEHMAIIENKDYYHKIMPNHNECNTFNTFTVYVGSNNVSFEGLVIKNMATPSEIYGQAVALHVDGTNFMCKNCQISSAQDTLFTGPMPADLLKRYDGFYPSIRLKGLSSIQKYIDCQISGDVDFIFGCATALFENCDIISIRRSTDTPTFIAAPSHPKDLKYGYLFYKCNLIGTQQAFLARPWRDYGSAAFILCNMDEHIHQLGFNKWNDTNRDKTARFYEYTPNKDLTKREPWITILNEIEAEEFVKDFKTYINTK